MALTPEEIEAKISGLTKAVNDSAASLDALSKKPSADPAMVETLKADILALSTAIQKLGSSESKPGSVGFFDEVGAALDTIFG